MLVVQMPSDPSVSRFYTALLAATGAPRAGRQSQAGRPGAGRTARAADDGRPRPGHRRTAQPAQRPGRPAPGVPEPPAVPGQRAAHPPGRRRDPRGLPRDPLRRPAGEPVRPVPPAPMGARPRGMLPAGQLRRVLPAAPPFPDRHHRDGLLPADPQRGHHRRAGRPAHRGGRRRDQVRRGSHHPANPASWRTTPGRPSGAACSSASSRDFRRDSGGRCTRRPARASR